MQTFLPHSSYRLSAQCLDDKRLGKQCDEALQLMQTIVGISSGWRQHPACLMWQGHEQELLDYGLAMSEEWARRFSGHRLTYYQMTLIRSDINLFFGTEKRQPRWLGDPRLHSSHRAALLAKDPDWYGQFGWEEEPRVDYFWPTDHGL